jgi:hypothetical protein
LPDEAAKDGFLCRAAFSLPSGASLPLARPHTAQVASLPHITHHPPLPPNSVRPGRFCRALAALRANTQNCALLHGLLISNTRTAYNTPNTLCCTRAHPPIQSIARPREIVPGSPNSSSHLARPGPGLTLPATPRGTCPPPYLVPCSEVHLSSQKKTSFGPPRLARSGLVFLFSFFRLILADKACSFYCCRSTLCVPHVFCVTPPLAELGI